MIKKIVKASEQINGKKVFVAEGELDHAETLEDIILMEESKQLTEKEIVDHFNASRRIEFQRQLKVKDTTKVKDKEKINKVFALAANDPILAQKLKDAGLL